jgi:Glycosyltransferase family 87
MRNDRDGLAGALIALGVLFKVYPVILLAFFVLKGRWRGLLGFTLGMLAYNGVAVAVMGWEMHRQYLFEVIPRIGGTTSWVENQTISGFMARFVDTPYDAHIFANRPISLLATAISGLLSLLACWLTLRPAEGRSTAFALQYCQFLLLMVLVVPAAWMHYQTLLVLVFGVLLIHLRERELPLSEAAILALGFALISYGNQWSFGNTTVMGIISMAGTSYKFYGMLLIGAVLLRELFALPSVVSLPALPRVRLLGNKATR